MSGTHFLIAKLKVLLLWTINDYSKHPVRLTTGVIPGIIVGKESKVEKHKKFVGECVD